nr:hypothetical protein [Tanacetum cinerariifolium]
MNGDCVLGEVCELLTDGASWSTVVEESEPIDPVGSRATTPAIRAMTLGTGRSTLGGGVSNSYDIEGGGFDTSPKMIVAEVIS